MWPKKTVSILCVAGSQIVRRVAVSLISIEGDEKFATKHKVSKFQLASFQGEDIVELVQVRLGLIWGVSAICGLCSEQSLYKVADHILNIVKSVNSCGSLS